MKRLIGFLFSVLLCLGAASAHAERTFNQAELDALLAPVALYPDPLLAHILNASLYPYDVQAAVQWSRANPNLSTDDALRAVEGELWHPSVKALVAYPDVLGRMGESPQWVADLGEAYQYSYPALSATVQQLRSRAQATGHLRTNEQQYVYQQNDAIYVQPVYPNVVYAPYYNPYVVYGTWWWPAVVPVFWRPWVAHPVHVTRVVHPARVWHHGPAVHPHHHVVRPHNPVHVAPNVVRQPVGQIRPLNPSPMPTPRAVTPRQVQSQTYHRIPESQRAPIVRSTPERVRAPAVQAPVPQMRGNSGHTSHGGGPRGRGGHGSARRG